MNDEALGAQELVAAGALANDFWWWWFCGESADEVIVRICVRTNGDLPSAVALALVLLRAQRYVRRVAVTPRHDLRTHDLFVIVDPAWYANRPSPRDVVAAALGESRCGIRGMRR